jgi:hypothetical protein
MLGYCTYMYSTRREGKNLCKVNEIGKKRYCSWRGLGYTRTSLIKRKDKTCIREHKDRIYSRNMERKTKVNQGEMEIDM